MPLKKPDDTLGVRPTAVGETLCRLLELVVLKRSVVNALRLLLLHQLGVAIQDVTMFISRACYKVTRFF